MCELETTVTREESRRPLGKGPRAEERWSLEQVLMSRFTEWVREGRCFRWREMHAQIARWKKAWALLEQRRKGQNKHRGHGRRPSGKRAVGVGLPRARGHCLADSGTLRAEWMLRVESLFLPTPCGAHASPSPQGNPLSRKWNTHGPCFCVESVG